MTQALITRDQADQRITLLESYNPKEHLVIIPTKQGQKPYYPAAWRLYELSLRYTDANFKSEIVFMDVDKDIVIVKAYLFLGPDYATSTKKAEAFKQGKLSMLDKIETAAKARAARDFGISTELALDMDDDSVDGEVASTLAKSTVTQETNGHDAKVVEAGKASKQGAQSNNGGSLSDMIARAKHRAADLGVVSNAEEWQALLQHLRIPEIKSAADLAKIGGYLSNVEQKKTNSVAR